MMTSWLLSKKLATILKRPNLLRTNSCILVKYEDIYQKYGLSPLYNGGEKYYTDEVAEKIENIVETAKKLMQEIAVVDFTTAA